MPNLYIKWKIPDDLGARPITPCGPPNYVWVNASMGMRSVPTDGSQPQGLNQATQGQPTKITVSVSSKEGSYPPVMPSGNFVQVQIWVCKPATNPQDATTFPFSDTQSATQVVAPSGQNPGNAGLAVSSVWTPGASGHHCLMANCFWEPFDPATDPAADGVTMPGNPVLKLCGDDSATPNVFDGGHHGQRNIEVAAGPVTTMSIEVNGPKKGKHEEFEIELVEQLKFKDPGHAVLEALINDDLVTMVGPKLRKPKLIKVGDEVLFVETKEQSLLKAGGRLVLAQERKVTLAPAAKPAKEVMLSTKGGSGRKLTVAPAPGTAEKVKFHFEHNPKDPVGTYRIFDVVQRRPKAHKPGASRLVGGYTVVAVKV